MCSLFSSSLIWIWEFSKAHPGTILVVVGVVGELADIAIKKISHDWHKKYEGKLEWIELFFGLLVVAGLLCEFGEIKKSDRDSAELKVFAANIGTTNARLVADNLVLRSNVVALEWQVMETKTNIAQIDPLKKPIIFVTATLTLSIGSTNNRAHSQRPMVIFGNDSDPVADFPWNAKNVVINLLLTNNVRHSENIITLRCLNIKSSDSLVIDGQTRSIMKLNFEINSLENEVRELEGRQMLGNGSASTWAANTFSVNDFDRYGIAGFVTKLPLPEELEVKGGKCSIRFNSSIERNFIADAPSRGGLMMLKNDSP